MVWFNPLYLNCKVDHIVICLPLLSDWMFHIELMVIVASSDGLVLVISFLWKELYIQVHFLPYPPDSFRPIWAMCHLMRMWRLHPIQHTTTHMVKRHPQHAPCPLCPTLYFQQVQRNVYCRLIIKIWYCLGFSIGMVISKFIGIIKARYFASSHALSLSRIRYQ